MPSNYRVGRSDFWIRFRPEVGRLPQQTGYLRTLKVPVRVRGQSSHWSGKTIWQEEEMMMILSDVPVLVKRASSRYM